MSGETVHTIHSLSQEFIDTIQAFSRFLEIQKALGIPGVELSDIAHWKMAYWGRPLKMAPPVYQGPASARVFVLDSQGTFYRGDAGALLKKILKAMDLDPASVFICHTTDISWLHERIETYGPGVIIALGEAAGQVVLSRTDSLDNFQGQVHACLTVPVMVTFHPATLLSRPELKRKVWDDMQQVMKILESTHGA
jgi:DNA polymerase